MDAPVCLHPATLADAGIISRIVERSIRVGCALDHRNDPYLVTSWIDQRSADRICAWLADPRHYLNIALLQDKPVGVGMAMVGGDIAFCHVQPEWFRRGVGRAVMADLEGWLSAHGSIRSCLDSTRTGEAFYRHLGYRNSTLPTLRNGLHALPMHKGLSL